MPRMATALPGSAPWRSATTTTSAARTMRRLAPTSFPSRGTRSARSASARRGGFRSAAEGRPSARGSMATPARACASGMPKGARPATSLREEFPHHPWGISLLVAGDRSSLRRFAPPVGVPLLEIQREVERGRRVREGADRDPVDASLGDGADRLQVHSARGFGGGAAVDQLDAPGHYVGRHVVEHDDVGARLDRGTNLLDAVALDLDLGARGGEVARAA